MVRDDLAIQLDRMTEAREVHAMGAFGDARGGFVDMEFERAEDLFAMLDGPLLDCGEVEVRPVMPVLRLSETVRAEEPAHA